MPGCKTIALTLVLLSATALAAQAPPAGPAKPPAGPVPDPKLSFDREVFHYPGDGRKDPFRALVGTEGLGPLFEDLTLRGIVFFPNNPRMSLATISDGTKRLFKVRVGDVVGNARVSSIEKNSIKLLVQSYGSVREEVLNMATRPTAEEFRSRQGGGTDAQLQRLFQQELLKALTGQAGQPDTTRRTPPPRDTTSTRNQER